MAFTPAIRQQGLPIILLMITAFLTHIGESESLDTEDEFDFAKWGIFAEEEDPSKNHQEDAHHFADHDRHMTRLKMLEEIEKWEREKQNQRRGYHEDKSVTLRNTPFPLLVKERKGPPKDDSTTTTTEEPYLHAIERLKCDNPWFWNSFKCLHLDVKERNYVERTTTNFITVSFFLGPPLVLLILALCAFGVTTVYMKSRLRALDRKIEEYRNRYEPGSIELDDGTIRKYPPTHDEIAAFEHLISTLISLV